MKIKSKRVLACLLTLALLVPALSLTASASNVTTGQRFTDVSPDAWYYEAVTAMADAGIVNGTGNGKFEPTRPMTAGELATVLWNMTYGDWCKATELYQTFNNGTIGGTGGYNTNNYAGPRIGNWGIPKDRSLVTAVAFSWHDLVPTTWDGPVALAVYGDSRIDPANGNSPYSAVEAGMQITTSGYGRLAGKLYSTYNNQPGDKYYSRDMSGLAVVAMSTEYVTRGFALSELVNVLRQTGNLESIYNASGKKTTYATGASIPDWSDITNVYHDVCSASVKSSGNSWCNSDGKYLFHDYTWAWDYIDEPGKTTISGGYANTWFSADVLLAYQAGIVSGKDASGRCDVGASMTRAEVCQMLYNAGVTNLKPQNQARGGIVRAFRFVRDGKIYDCQPVASKTSGAHVFYLDPYDANSNAVQGEGICIYKVYDNGVDIRQQEWPTHPEFWGN